MTDTAFKLAAAGRRVQSGLGLLFAVLALFPSHSPAAPAAHRLATVQRTEADRVVFRVKVPDARLIPGGTLKGTERIQIDGYSRIGDPGAPPTLTRTFLVGLPADGAYTLTYRLISSTPLGTHRLEPVATPIGIHDDDLGPGISERVQWNEEVFQAYRDPALVSSDAVVYVRHQRALPVRVNPIAYDPKSQTLSVAKEIEVEVRFAGAPRRADESAGVVPNESKDWNDIYGRLIVNAGQAKPWRTRTPVVSNFTAGAAARVLPGAVKIRVYQTGVHAVLASRIIAAGFPGGQPVANLRLFRRTYSETTLSAGETDIACEVNEAAAGTPGVFDGNDELVFYGRRLRDDPNQPDAKEQYSSYNVYWLEPSNGARMAQSTPGVGFVTGDTLTATFPAQDHFEIDNVFRDKAKAGLPGPEDLYFYNYGDEPGPVDMPFTVGNIQPGTSLSLASELHGQTYDSPRSIRLSLNNSNGDQVLNPAYPIPLKMRRVFRTTIPAANLDLGTNQFRLTKVQTTSVQVLLNWVDVSYSSLYRARGNTLRFNSASLAGDTTIAVTGITSTAGLELLDITNPDQPVRLVLSAGHFKPAAAGSVLAFRENFGSRRQYMLIPDARMVNVKAADVVADAPSTIIGGSAEGGIDVLAVAHHDFISQMHQWASYRRAQGYRVLLVDADDVFDEFNGGIPSARAIYRFARHFYEHADASALVLVGDASEDHKHVRDDSGPDFVPTFTRTDSVTVLQTDEVVSTDKKFVKFPGPGGVVDNVPDMIVGRMPVGDTGELTSVLGKVFAYEAPAASDFWRKRMIIVADDEFSDGSSGFGGAFTLCNNNEFGFQAGQEQVAQMIENSLPAGYDVVRFYLKTYTDAFYNNQCANLNAAITYTRQNVTEKLMNELNQGATMVTIQSHMNRYVVCHERLLSGEPASLLNGATGRDYLRMQNRLKPWLIFAMGCHFSEFAPDREMSSIYSFTNAPNGDCFAEQLLFSDERGAVNTYGSSGFEYLDRNMDYMSTIGAVWFYQAPYDTMTAQTQAEWKFGQLMYLVEAQMATVSPFQAEAVERYHILGDPMLRIDAGPPAFNVTVNGRPAQSGDVVSTGGEVDSLNVVAIVTDENAIHKFGLEIDGQDMTDSLKVVRTSDPDLPNARQYRVSFHHLLLPRTYDIVLRAYQAPDTTLGQYHMAAEFRLKVESSIAVAVNGRPIQSGASVPADGNYRVDLSFPVFIPQSDISIKIDDVVVADAQYAHPAPEDSLSWIVTFRKTLAAGKHHMLIDAQGIQFNYVLVVSETSGLANVINYPNPFAGAGTRFVYTNEVEIETGTIDIYTVSGKKVRRIDIPTASKLPGQNSVFWDGRDTAGGTLANGVYLYVINVHQRSGNATVRGTTHKIE